MKNVLSETKTIAAICGEQKAGGKAEYRLSKYTFRVPCEDGELYYHVLTGALVLLEAGEVMDSQREELIRRRFLVPADLDENKYVRSVRKIATMLHPADKNKTFFSVMTTTDCNARCFYCYEQGVLRKNMSDETALDVASYISRVSGGKQVKISWFGGEPLYNKRAITIIADHLNENRIPFTSIMTSNGYYLDAQTAREAKDKWHLEHVQITLDGTEEIYNKTKAYINKDPNACQRVLDNIETALKEGIRVFIRLNIDAQNADDLLVLCDDITQRFGHYPDLFVQPILLRELAGSIHHFDSVEDMIEKYYAIVEKLEKSDLIEKKDLDRGLRINQCMADNDSSETILPDGRISKCEHCLENSVGSIYSDEYDREGSDSWKERIDFPECETCALYPRCINLKRCDWLRNGCSESTRIIRKRRLSDQVLSLYAHEKEKWRKQNEA